MYPGGEIRSDQCVSCDARVRVLAEKGEEDDPMTDRRYHHSAVHEASTLTLEMPELLDAARLGDESAFNDLIANYQSTAQRVAQQILRTEEAAADAVQDALLKVHRALPRFKDGNFRSWLLRIVTNTCYDHLRSLRRRPSVSLDELTDEQGVEFPDRSSQAQRNPESVVTQRESMQYLLNAVAELPTWHRDVVVLIDVHGYDYGEAAQALDLPLGTVKSRLSRARAALRDSLLQAGYVHAAPPA
jgi:RNA polymerase sigma-70 factor, ECF subfamily